MQLIISCSRLVSVAIFAASCASSDRRRHNPADDRGHVVAREPEFARVHLSDGLEQDFGLVPLVDDASRPGCNHAGMRRGIRDGRHAKHARRWSRGDQSSQRAVVANTWRVEIDQDNVGPEVAEHGGRFLQLVSFAKHGKTWLSLQHVGQGAPQEHLIVDEKEVYRACHVFFGPPCEPQSSARQQRWCK